MSNVLKMIYDYWLWYRKRYIEVYLCGIPGCKPIVQQWRNKTLAKGDGEVYIVSFPKSGRTWLRMILGKVLIMHFRQNEKDFLDLWRITKREETFPTVKVTHDDNPHWKTPSELLTTKEEYTKKRVIFLIRDPRDVIVSEYFHKTRRVKRKYRGTLSQYIRSSRGSLATLIEFYNIWTLHQHVPADFLIVKYEDLHKTLRDEIVRVIDFLGVKNVEDEIIQNAIEASTLDNMQTIERTQLYQGAALKLHNEADPESFKARRGKVKGYTDYLSPDDIMYIEQIINSKLSDFYEFYKYWTQQ